MQLRQFLLLFKLQGEQSYFKLKRPTYKCFLWKRLYFDLINIQICHMWLKSFQCVWDFCHVGKLFKSFLSLGAILPFTVWIYKLTFTVPQQMSSVTDIFLWISGRSVTETSISTHNPPASQKHLLYPLFKERLSKQWALHGGVLWITSSSSCIVSHLQSHNLVSCWFMNYCTSCLLHYQTFSLITAMMTLLNDQQI